MNFDNDDKLTSEMVGKDFIIYCKPKREWLKLLEIKDCERII